MPHSSAELTKRQARAMHDRLLPTLGYLWKMLARIDERNYPHDDNLRRCVAKARDATVELLMTLHCTGCGASVYS